MNRNMILRAIMLVLASHLLAQHLNAALPTAGEWPATTITGNETVNLTGDVVIKGAITIPSGASLTITGAGQTITPLYNNKSTMGWNDNITSFYLEGNLTIEGTDGNHIKIKGLNTASFGYDGSGNDVSFEGLVNSDYWYNNNLADDGANYSSNFILQEGSTGSKLTLRYVDISNIMHYASYYASVLCLSDGNSTNPNNVLLEYVNIDNCMGFTGNSIIKYDNNAWNTTTMNHCNITNSRAYGYGGVLTSHGGGNCRVIVTMNDCTMNNCVSSGWGGAILWAANASNGSKLVLNRCTFENNYARCLGGAISNEGVIELTDCIIKNNVAGYGGGGIASFPFTTGGLGEAVGLVFNSGNKIIGNKTLHESTGGMTGKFEAFGKTYPAGGGGLWILMNLDGWTCNASIASGNEFSDNTSAYFGGGVFLYKAAPGGADYTSKGDTSLTTGAAITGNKAQSGGGVAIGADDIVSVLPDVTVEGGEISGNTAINGNGGGIYMPGGIFNMTDGSIGNNWAKATDSSDLSKGNGGGFDMKNGIVTVSGNAVVSDNNCTHYGAGLYVHNTESTLINTTFTGGTIKNNGKTSCFAGGGICVAGNINFTTTATNIEGNNATNGGGICVINGAKMTYKSGLVRSNTAKTATTITGSTAYLKDVTQVAGFGGGVFVADNGSSLTLDISDGKLGLYGNLATNGADDIFANGNGTSVTVPNVTSMTLTDFSVPVPANSLFWAEDYSTDDTGYGNGTKINTAWSGTNLRYRNAWKNMQAPFQVPAQTLTKYTSLALGYGIIYVTVKKTGLKKGQSAVFQLTKQGDSKPYITVILTGKDDSGTAVQRSVALFAGTWTVKETNWSWAYSSDVTEITHSFTKQSDAGTLYEFVNTPKPDTPQHNESIKVNRFRN